jgi:uncharacterized cofD-like protein
MAKKKPKVVVIGGGTGTFTVLTGLRHYPVDLTAIIGMADSGGSNRILRDEFGILPTSDIRQCLVALADDNGERKVFRDLFTYRFHQGTGIAGMTFGNLFMAALTDIYRSQQKAIEKTGEILNIKGEILPVSLDDVQLVARYENGHQVVGEHYIDEPRHDGKLRIVEMETIPRAKAFKKAVQAILAADLVVLGPGDLYTSLVCNLVVEGIPEALKKTKAKVAYVMNLMGRYGQTFKFTAKDHLEVLEKYLGKKVVDYVLVNNTPLPKRILKRYQEEQAHPVKDDLGKPKDIKVIRKNFLSGEVHQKAKGDKLQRSMIRHDPKKLAKALVKLT